MYQLSRQEFLAHFFKDFRCGNCGSDAGYASRPRSFFERFVVPIFFLKTVRCGDCYHRSLRPMHVYVRPRRENLNADHFRAAVSLAETTLSEGRRKEPQKEMPDPANDRQHIA
jgi:hypothetical protein